MDWFSQFGVEELASPAQSPDFNHIQHLWDELEHRLRANPNHPTSVLDVPNALEAEWEQSPAAIFQTLVEILKPEEWRLWMLMALEWDAPQSLL